jgi:hypothetical protein
MTFRSSLRHAGSRRGLGLDRTAGTAVTLGIVMPLLMACAGAAVNYVVIAGEQVRLQDIADAASTNAARELGIARADPLYVQAVAVNFATAMLTRSGQSLTGVQVTAKVVPEKGSVEVGIVSNADLPLPIPMVSSSYSIGVGAVARTTAGPPICVIALDDAADSAIMMDGEAKLTGEGCAVYSNAKSDRGIAGRKTSVLTADLICSAGGYSGGSSNFNPGVLTDCPPVPDPLVDRSPPAEKPCLHSGMEVTKGPVTLQPGTYCGGLTVSGKAVVNLAPGHYLIKDGPLKVENGTLTGQNVSFHLKGGDALIKFNPKSSISLTAPKDGPLAGFLFFEDRGSKDLREHRIVSDDARNLLGTIYLPKGKLLVDAPAKVADLSAYTIIVARRVELRSNPNLVLNTGYGSTDIPVPRGVGPIGATVSLVR